MPFGPSGVERDSDLGLVCLDDPLNLASDVVLEFAHDGAQGKTVEGDSHSDRVHPTAKRRYEGCHSKVPKLGFQKSLSKGPRT